MLIGVPKEVHRGECRVAATPDTAERLQKLGYSVAMEAGAGAVAQFTDEAYREAGAEIVEETRDLWGNADIILKVRSPEAHPMLGTHEAEFLREGQTLLSFVWPAQNPELMALLAEKKVTVLAMDEPEMVPNSADDTTDTFASPPV